MGDPKKQRKKYSGPKHPWNKSRIEEEKVLVKDYGLAAKSEISKAVSMLNRYKTIAKQTAYATTGQLRLQRDQLRSKLVRLGLITPTASIDDVLGLDVRKVLDRRLQSFVFKRGLARSMKQARQMITHQHVIVGDRMITSPCYFVLAGEESQITFHHTSLFNNEMHPERIPFVKKVRPVRVKEKFHGKRKRR